MASRLRQLIFGNLMRTLAVLLGLTQVLIGHWVTVVVAQREGPGLVFGTSLAVALVVANVYTLPIVRRARQSSGWPRRVARGYMSAGLATLLLGLAIGVSWVGLFPLAAFLPLLGVNSALAFDLFRAASTGVVAALAFMLVWGFSLGQRRVELTRVRVEIPGLAECHRGIRIVQVSDFHIGNGLEGPRLAAVVAKINRLAPDLIALTGDLFDFDPSFVDDGSRELGALRARLGVFAVLGNHDTYTGTPAVVGALAKHAPGVRLLRGDIVSVGGDVPLYVAGVDDPGRDWTARGVHIDELETMAEKMPSDGPVVLLVHRPEAFSQASRLGFPLVLAGHTHGGQIALPTPGGRYNLARIMTGFSRGLYRQNGSTLYVNRGVGVAGPAIRFNCNREIATIELA